MKKVLIIIASIITITAALSGCGAEESSTAETTAVTTTSAQTTSPVSTAPTTTPNDNAYDHHAVSDETYPEYTGPTLSREELYNQGAVLEECQT